jgi:hypothetical protein
MLTARPHLRGPISADNIARGRILADEGLPGALLVDCTAYLCRVLPHHGSEVACQDGPAWLVEVVGVDLVVPGINHISERTETPGTDSPDRYYHSKCCMIGIWYIELSIVLVCLSPTLEGVVLVCRRG